MRAGELDFRISGPAEQRNRQQDRRKYAGAALFLAAVFAMDRSAPSPGVVTTTDIKTGARITVTTTGNSNSKANDGGTGNGNSNANSNANGTSNANGNSNANGTGNANGTSNANDNGSGNRPPPIARVLVTPARIEFARLEVGAASPPQQITFQNSGTAAGALGRITLSDSANFRFVRSTCPDGQIPAHSECYGEVRFQPAMAGPAMATLTRVGSTPVQLVGQADPKVVVPAAPLAQFDQKMYSFGELYTDTSLTKIPVLKNAGTTPIQDLRFRLEGDHIDDFSPRLPNCAPLAPGDSCGVPITFLANHDGQHEVFLVASTAGRELDRAALDGGVRRRPVPKADITPNPAEFDNKQRVQTLYVRNTGDGDLKFDQFSVDDGADFMVDFSTCLRAQPLRRGEGCPVQVTFKGKKSAAGMVTVLDNDPSRSQRIVLSANVSNSDLKKRLIGLAVAGVISAGVAEAVSHRGGDKNPPVDTKPTEPTTPNRNGYQPPRSNDVIR